jgi:hypothetical protein
MGWWKMNDRGQIDESHFVNGLVNAVPNRDTPENYYNGDGPADSIDDAVHDVLAVLGIAVPRPDSSEIVQGISQQEMLDLFLRAEVPDRFKQDSRGLVKIIDAAWKDVDEQYEEDWDRPAYPQERLGACNFVFNPMFNLD